MGKRFSTAVKRSAAALALIVATPALGPTLHVTHLALDPMANWTLALGPDLGAADLGVGLWAAGTPVPPDALDLVDLTLLASQVEGVVHDAMAVTVEGSTPSNGSLPGGGSRSSNFGSDISGTVDGTSHASIGDGVKGGAAHSQNAPARSGNTAPDSPTVFTLGRNARQVGAGPVMAPPIALFPQPVSPPAGDTGLPWQHPVIATGPDVILKDDDFPILDDVTNPGNNELLGPFPTNDGTPSYPDGPVGFTPMGITPFSDLRVVVNAVPEPGTLALVAFGLAALALSRRKR